MKRSFAALAAAALMIASVFSVSADGLIPDEYYNANKVPDQRLQPRLVDAADILSDSEESRLLDKLDRISDAKGVDVVVLTVYSPEDRAVGLYAEDYFVYNGMGQGSEHDGFMLMISMKDRDVWICTHGSGEEIFTDYGQDYLFDEIASELKHDDFYAAFDRYADISEKFITEWEKGTPYDVDHKVKGKLPLRWIFIALGGGLLIGLIYSQSVKSQLTSVKMQHGADAYIRQGSFRITGSRDTFLYRKVQRDRIDSDSGSRGGGGSSVHMHSSGSSFGGSGRKF